jgi:hypothetical protein
MSTTVLATQSVSAQQRDVDLEFNMAASPAMYGPSDRWASSSQESLSYTSLTEYTGFPVDSTRQPEHFSTGSPILAHPRQHQHNFYNGSVPESTFESLKMQSSVNAPLRASTMAVYQAPATLTASNAQINACDDATLLPLDTHCGVHQTSPGSDAKSRFGRLTNPIAPSDFAPFTNNGDPSSPSSKRRCDSL